MEAEKTVKNIHCEKPMSITIREARQMVTAMRRYNRVFQTGSLQHSAYDGKFKFALRWSATAESAI